MYEWLKGLAALLLMPLPLALGLSALGLALAWCGRRRLGAGIAGLAVAGLLLAGWGPVADRLLGPLEARYPALHTLPADPPTAAVVVLGGGWQPQAPWSVTARLQDSSAIRLLEGVRLWRQRPALPLVVTGASRDVTQPPVARGYARAAQTLGVPDERLRVLDTPTDTGREARAVSEALGEGARVVVVTSASHMPRAMRHFRRAGLAPIAAPTHYLAGRNAAQGLAHWVPSATHLRKTERAVYEVLGQLAVGFEH